LKKLFKDFKKNVIAHLLTNAYGCHVYCLVNGYSFLKIDNNCFLFANYQYLQVRKTSRWMISRIFMNITNGGAFYGSENIDTVEGSKNKARNMCLHLLKYDLATKHCVLSRPEIAKIKDGDIKGEI
jgi:hypothetical protein